MPTFDVFNTDAFNTISLTNAIRDVKTVPTFLESLGIFTPVPVRTETIAVEQVGDGTLALVPTTERGTPPTTIGRDRRSIRNFNTVRLRQVDTIQASEFQNVRAFGSETELMAVASEIAMRQEKLIRRLRLTQEYHRLGAINGIVLDADGSTVIRNYFTEFGVAAPTEIAFNWASRTAVKTFVATNVKRPMVRALGGRATPNMRIVALCGDTFYDAMQENAEYRATYLNGIANPASLREDNTWESIRAWGIEWVNYRGTDDNSTVAIAADKCKFIPVGVDDVFQVAYSPGESFDFVNTLGQEFYSMIERDPSGLNEWAKLHVASYPLYMCLAPQALLNGRSGA